MKNSSLPVEEQVELLFTERFGRDFIRNLIQYMNKDWAKDENNLLDDRKVQMLINIMVSKFSSFTELVNDFLST